MDATIRKAIFPAAGLGTRFLPATKAQPKEMLVLVDKPVIQYGVEEAVASGVDNIVIVTGRGKNAIEDHFDVNIELESFLEQRGKKEQLAEVRKISQMIQLAYVRQGSRSAWDTRCWSPRRSSATSRSPSSSATTSSTPRRRRCEQMIDVFHRVGGPVLAVERVPHGARVELRRRGDRRSRDLGPGSTASRTWSRSRA
jgi:UTP--glucose-1-phosphate uridylyltransferase